MSSKRKPTKVNLSFQMGDKVPRTVGENLKWRRSVLERCETDMDYRASIMATCARDPLFFINTFCWTYDTRLVGLGRNPNLPFVTWDFQDRAIRDLAEGLGVEDVVWEKSRGVGGTYQFCAIAVWQNVFSRVAVDGLIVSRVEEDVDLEGNPGCIMWKIDYMLEKLPEWMRPNITRRKLKIRNTDTGSIIIGKATVEDVGRSSRPLWVFFDEFAFVPDGEAMMRATTAATWCRVYCSTHKGRDTAFYRLTTNPKIRKVRMHWAEHPIFGSGEYRILSDGTIRHSDRPLHPVIRELLKMPDNKRYPEDYDFETVRWRDKFSIRSPWFDLQCDRASSPAEIAQELEMDPIMSASPFFDVTDLDEIEKRDCTEPRKRCTLVVSEYHELEEMLDHPRGHMSFWCDTEMRPSADQHFVIGIDISNGTGHSNSVITVARKSGEKVAEFASSTVRPEQLASFTVAIARWFNNAWVCWEAQGPGEPFGARVWEIGYRHVWFARNEQDLVKKRKQRAGWYSNDALKYRLLMNYRRALATGQFVQRNKLSIDESRDYRHLPGGSVGHPHSINTDDPAGSGKNHGDRVIADALACMLCTQGSASDNKERKAYQSPKVGSLEYHKRIERKIKKERAGSIW